MSSPSSSDPPFRTGTTVGRVVVVSYGSWSVVRSSEVIRLTSKVVSRLPSPTSSSGVLHTDREGTLVRDEISDVTTL